MDLVEELTKKLEKIENAIIAQEGLRGVFPEEQVERSLFTLRQEKQAILLQLEDAGTKIAGDVNSGGGAVIPGVVKTQGGDFTGRDKNIKAGDEGMAIGGDVAGSTVVIARDGARVVIGEEQVEMSKVDRNTALGRYLAHLIARNRYLQLQGIRSGGRLVNIELEQIYITLRATQKRTIQAEEKWLAAEKSLAPGEPHRRHASRLEATETVSVRVDQALAEHRHLVVLGDPGSGKTTLLRYLALLYARDLASGDNQVAEKLDLDESGYLPILLPLRQVGSFLRKHPSLDKGTAGHALFLEFLFEALKNERIELPGDFFDAHLKDGKAVILLDGLDEVADPVLRRQTSRLVEAFTQAYPTCRFVVTSRIVGYSDPVRLDGDYATTTVRDFTLADVRAFLTNWHRLVAIGLMDAGKSALDYAADQTEQLMGAIQENERIRELAINPLMLTVIALVHKDRVKLPDRRAELYAEAVDVLLGKRDEARGIKVLPILGDQPFDTGDKRLLLQSVALYIHEKEQKEIDSENLRHLLCEHFGEMLSDQRSVRQAVERFLRNVAERAGLLLARAEGVYAFSHLTFQEYLAAKAIAARDDYVAYTLERTADAWWREVILLEAGYLSTQSKERTTRLIQAIAEQEKDPEPFYHLVLAVECLRDVGENRVYGNLARELRTQLRSELETPAPKGWLGSVKTLVTRGMTSQQLAKQRIAAANALGRIGGSGFWHGPFGEPEWVEIPAGEFWMGSESATAGDNEKPIHRVSLDAFLISRVPITNTQYALFVKATEHEPPRYWNDGKIPKGLESHPVVRVSWHEALAYCQWLGSAIGKSVTLPSEAQWEKAARGDRDQREYPWGDTFKAIYCNTSELGLFATTPVGIFLEGASLYGVLDLSGNVLEWTRSLKKEYPYDSGDGREDLEASGSRVLRGGSWRGDSWYARCAARGRGAPDSFGDYVGFRVVVSLAISDF